VSATVLPPDPNDPESADLEIDEVWSFVGSKKHEVYAWVALCRKTRQVGGMALGNRSAASCWRLWLSMPLAYRSGFWYTDFWQAYQAVLPDSQQVAGGKESGQTNHIERWNNTLRQRLGRSVRKTLSFSKSFVMHWICLHCFLHRYHLQIAVLRA
jgi:insertion element IS1 protein InsB